MGITVTDQRNRLGQAIARRDAAQKDAQRLQGRYEAAKEEVARIEGECRAKGLDPDKLESSIAKLQERYESAISEFESQVNQAEQDLAPFLREDG
jgi:predicted nuclease with TOPRIM domain